LLLGALLAGDSAVVRRCGGLLLWARRAEDIDRQRLPPGTKQHGT